MCISRIGLYAAIGVVSFVLAGVLLDRQRRRADAIAAPAPPPEPSPTATSVVAAPPPVPAEPRTRPVPDPEPDPRSDAWCSPGMVAVSGTVCAVPTRTCAERAAGGECSRYEPARCREGLALRFCIDRYEYPNQKGVVPATLVTFAQARAACEAEGKRLCREMEWAFACEGPEGLAYGYADDLDGERCNARGEPARLRPDELWESADVVRALGRSDGRATSGGFPRCSTPFAVQDAIGNVEEWVQSDVPGFESALRGGGHSSPDAVCRSVRLIRQRGFRDLSTGFRCCRDPLVGGMPAGSSGATPAVAPGTAFD